MNKQLSLIANLNLTHIGNMHSFSHFFLPGKRVNFLTKQGTVKLAILRIPFSALNSSKSIPNPKAHDFDKQGPVSSKVLTTNEPGLGSCGLHPRSKVSVVLKMK